MSKVWDDPRFRNDGKRGDIPPCQVADEPVLDPRTAEIGEDLRCVLYHGHTCLRIMDLDLIRRCPACYTDYAFNGQIPSEDTEQRVLIFTCWKNLGTGDSRDDPVWKSHIVDSHPTAQLPPPLEDTPLAGEQFRLYEAVSAGKEWAMFTEYVKRRPCTQLWEKLLAPRVWPRQGDFSEGTYPGYRNDQSEGRRKSRWRKGWSMGMGRA